MEKTQIYFVPGLAASKKIFENLKFPKDKFETHCIEWKIPLSLEESITDYAKRMCDEIKHENPVLIGVSFGGIMVQEMSKIIKTKKIVVISSIESNKELPTLLKVAQRTKVYKLFPTKFVENIEDYTKYFYGDFLQKRARLYKMYLSVRNPDYLHWSIYNVLFWNQEEPLENVLHIHGTKDHIFPIKYIKNCVVIENGTHEMILIKPKIIVEHIINSLT
jgi:pimeloyl-ACP methyl ester carboxylesterase